MGENQEGNTRSDAEGPRFPTAAHAQLNVFAGKWKTEGQTRESTSSPAVSIRGTDTYEWLEGGYFLVHHVDVHLGAEFTKVIEIIGYDAEHNNYTTAAYDSQGNSGNYTATLKNGVWKFDGESERATAIFNEDGNEIKIHWEQLTEEKNWMPWMDVKLTRDKST
jgi:Protein of unknown function (DUF1579)